MGRTPLYRRLLQGILRSSETSAEADARLAAEERGRLGRRDVLRGAGIALGALAMPRALAACASPDEPGGGDDPLTRARANLKAVNIDVGIVGAGIAGVACAYELKRVGVKATVHEGNTRIGGRIYSMGGAFADPVGWMGQCIERGGELIDTPHKTMQAYANELGLQLEDITKPKRDTFYRFGNTTISEATMVDEYRVLAAAMQKDLQTIGWPTADAFSPADAAMDRTSLAQYLATRAPTNIRNLLTVAYEIEYGIPVDQMSCLAFLLFAKASKQSKLRLWGNFSDERYHTIGGNQQIPVGLAARMPGQVLLGQKLVAMRKLSDGRIELTLVDNGRTITVKHDAVVLALPFHLLRDVSIDPSIGFSDAKKYAIQNFVTGDNAKLMVGFQGQPWVEKGGCGACYSDMPYLQTTWETNPTLANSAHAVITDYTGGALSRSLRDPQRDGENFLGNFDVMIPGAKARARRDAKGKLIAHLEAWPSNPWSKGAYSANQVGYFTTIEGNPAKSAGNVYFAGEQTDAFYEWQGFMEGAALTGLRAAGEISRDF